jgi:hypothetical protein
MKPSTTNGKLKICEGFDCEYPSVVCDFGLVSFEVSEEGVPETIVI